jgi:hypothetical protein
MPESKNQHLGDTEEQSQTEEQNQHPGIIIHLPLSSSVPLYAYSFSGCGIAERSGETEDFLFLCAPRLRVLRVSA